MASSETVLNRTDRMLNLLIRETQESDVNSRETATSLWKAGLMAAPLFVVGDDLQASADREAQRLVERHLASKPERQHVATVQLLEFQYSLQMRSKVISAIERLVQA